MDLPANSLKTVCVSFDVYWVHLDCVFLQVQQCPESFNTLPAHFLFVTDRCPAGLTGNYYPANSIIVAVRGTQDFLDVVTDVESNAVPFDIAQAAQEVVIRLLGMEVPMKTVDDRGKLEDITGQTIKEFISANITTGCRHNETGCAPLHLVHVTSDTTLLIVPLI